VRRDRNPCHAVWGGCGEEEGVVQGNENMGESDTVPVIRIKGKERNIWQFRERGNEGPEYRDPVHRLFGFEEYRCPQTRI